MSDAYYEKYGDQKNAAVMLRQKFAGRYCASFGLEYKLDRWGAWIVHKVPFNPDLKWSDLLVIWQAWNLAEYGSWDFECFSDCCLAKPDRAQTKAALASARLAIGLD